MAKLKPTTRRKLLLITAFTFSLLGYSNKDLDRDDAFDMMEKIQLM